MYKVMIKDYFGNVIEIRVSHEIYEVFEEERKYQKRIREERRRHLDSRPIEYIGTEEIKEAVRQAELSGVWEDIRNIRHILKEHCTDIQKRRFTLYYFEGFTLSEIAALEQCSVAAISHSLKKCIKQIQQYFKKFGLGG